MSWHKKYRLRELLHSSFWLYPSLALLLAWLIGKLAVLFVPDTDWPNYEAADIDGLRAMMGLFSSSLLLYVHPL